MKFGKLTITGFYGKRDNLKNNANYYNVECDCGNKRLVQFKSLTSGNTTSCGCIIKTELMFIKKDNYYIVTCSNGEFLIDIEDYNKINNINSNVCIGDGYAIYFIKQKRAISFERFTEKFMEMTILKMQTQIVTLL